MDPLTILIAIVGIVATGALTKVGENVTDAGLSKLNELSSRIRESSPSIADCLEDLDQNPLNYGKAYLEIEEIAKHDSHIIKLLEETKHLVLSEPKLFEIVEKELNKATPQLSSSVIENWKGINTKGGINVITGNKLHF